MDTNQQQAVFAITATVLASFIYFLLLDWMKSSGEGKKETILRRFYAVRKTTGFLLLGLIPGIVAWRMYGTGPSEAGLTWAFTSDIWIWVIAAVVFFTLMNLVNSRKEGIYAVYPEMRLKHWGYGDLFLSGSGWVLYLAGYEYLFRGLLLFSCYDAFGLWPAVVINLALYSALHLPKGMKEAIAAIPFGALLCYLTIESQSILAAIVIHAVQAISCEILCIWKNPEMNYKFSNNN